MNTYSDKTNEQKASMIVPHLTNLQKSNELPFQLKDNRPEAQVYENLKQLAMDNMQVSQLQSMQNLANNANFPIQLQHNTTGLPNNLKSGIEQLSGFSMNDVKVHYNSDKPAQLQAHAYAQGTDIHLASGQEKHLPHEAWHVVQQKQGRVEPTKQLKGKVNINDNAGLEHEADVMGEKALQMRSKETTNDLSVQKAPSPETAIQLQKANGPYQISSKANLRANDKDHTSRGKLEVGTKVKVINKGGKVSNFKAGWVTNEHSWIVIEGEDEYNDIEGWIEDGKLTAPWSTVQSQFEEGDKLYGRYEARNTILNNGDAENQSVRGTTHPIIDDLHTSIFHTGRHQALTHKGAVDPEGEGYRDYLARNNQVEIFSDRQENINRYCKQALIYYTNHDHTIHFMLDGIDPTRVMGERSAIRDEEPGVTGIELRALMRAAIRSKGKRGPKPDIDGNDIDLTRVKFYLNQVEVPAPWAATKDSVWGNLWKAYLKSKVG